MGLRDKLTGWFSTLMGVKDYGTFEEALASQGIHGENPVAMSDSIGLKLTKNDTTGTDTTATGDPVATGDPSLDVPNPALDNPDPNLDVPDPSLDVPNPALDFLDPLPYDPSLDNPFAPEPAPQFDEPYVAPDSNPTEDPSTPPDGPTDA
jgi:hypothetical protein